jgi:Family of unknown function (DUF5691)
VRLLDAAALMSRARRAGYRPPVVSVPAPEPAGPDTRPAVSQAARERLAALLAAGEGELVAEWRRNLAGRRPPDVLLPALLTAGSQDAGLRASLRPVLGPRARWLAAFSDDWSWCTGGADLVAGAPSSLKATWETATAAGRRELLTVIRAADPAAGRALVAATWDSDGYRDRAAFAGLLITGLSRADEPLAERALADRRAEVRRVGADLLARLPGSAYSRRAAARAAAAVRVRRGAVRTTLTVRPPSHPQDMLADQIDVTPPSGSQDATEWLLRQAVAAAPAGFWAGHTGLAPAQLLALAERSEWQGPLRSGWAAAAIRDGDTGWLTALLDAPGAHRNVTEELALFGALPPQAKDEWLLANPDGPLFGAALARLPPPWSEQLSDVVRSQLDSVARADPGRSPAPRALLGLAGRRLEPPVPPPVAATDVHDKLAVSWASMDSALSQRATMRRELAEEPPS